MGQSHNVFANYQSKMVVNAVLHVPTQRGWCRPVALPIPPLPNACKPLSKHNPKAGGYGFVGPYFLGPGRLLVIRMLMLTPGICNNTS